jgi:hypothetical protein
MLVITHEAATTEPCTVPMTEGPAKLVRAQA